MGLWKTVASKDTTVVKHCIFSVFWRQSTQSLFCMYRKSKVSRISTLSLVLPIIGQNVHWGIFTGAFQQSLVFLPVWFIPCNIQIWQNLYKRQQQNSYFSQQGAKIYTTVCMLKFYLEQLNSLLWLSNRPQHVSQSTELLSCHHPGFRRTLLQ